MFLIIFLLVIQYSMVTTISGCHSDRDNDHRPRVSCVNQGLTAVPDGIDPGTKTLVLSQNAFVSLTWAAYTTFTHLHELDLSQNQISTIKQSGPVLQHLRVLRLSNNTLVHLEGATFKSIPSLMEVYLDGNSISSLDDATFSDLPLLEVVDLSRNKLCILPHHLLEQISSSALKHFDLEDNHVKQLPENFFSSKPELPYVFLSKNDWVCTCQVSYLKRYLEDQEHNVYKHTGGPLSIENDAQGVVCSGPPTLKGRVILELIEEEYCSSESSPQTSITTLPNTVLPSTIVQSPHHMMSTQKTSNPKPITTTTTVVPLTINQPKTLTTVISTTSPTTIQTATPTVTYSTTPIPSTLTTSIPTTITPTASRLTTTTMSTTPTAVPPTTQTTTNPVKPTTSSLTTTPTADQPITLTTVIYSTTPIPTTLRTNIPKNITSRTITTIPLTTSAMFLSSHSPESSNPTTIKSVSVVTRPAGGVFSSHSGQRSVPWCWWLFITVVLLCIFSVIYSCMLSFWLIIIYIKLYQPIKRQVHGIQEVTLKAYQTTAGESLTANRTEEDRMLFLPPEMIQETEPVFRSMLFVSKGDEDDTADERRKETRKENEENKGRTDAGIKIELLPAVTVHSLQQTETKEREEVFRKTLYRVISREEEIEGWKEVEENCWDMMEREKGRREGGVERGKTRYSLILREERESVMEGSKGETEWLVGEWEMKRQQGSQGSLIRTKVECGLSASEK